MKKTRSLVACVAVIAAGLVAFATPAAAVPGPGLTTFTTFTGNGGYSADGLGQVGTGGTIQADVPAGSTVVNALLYGSYSDSDPSAADLTIAFDGTSVILAPIAQFNAVSNGVFLLTTARADVTTQVSTKVGPGGGITNFSVNTDPTNLEGVGLVVIYSNPGSPATAISIVDGAAKPAGDSATVTFPAFPSGGSAQMSLGIGYSSQDGLGDGRLGTHICPDFSSQQYSTIDVVKIDGIRLTSCAGNYDDGTAGNGGLITVGGISDSTDNPLYPNQYPGDGTSPRGQEDELYDLAPFISAGETSITMNTANPSSDDNLFLAVVSTSTTPKADLSVTKSDTAAGYGPDPVSSGNVVAYEVSVTNNGPNTATGIEVTDTVTGGGTIVDASGTNWTCTIDGTATCIRDEGFDSLASGATAEPITIEVQAPATETVTSIDDTATVSGNENDSNSDNNSDTESTAVYPPSGTEDHAAVFCPSTGCTVTTDSGAPGATPGDPTVSTLDVPAGVDPQTITLDEATNATHCGGMPCQGQVLTITSSADPKTFSGVDDPNVPVVLTMVFDKTVKQGSKVYVDKGDGPVVVRNCTTTGVAAPRPCVSEKNILVAGGDRAFIILFLEGDPIIGKR